MQGNSRQIISWIENAVRFLIGFALVFLAGVGVSQSAAGQDIRSIALEGRVSVADGSLPRSPISVSVNGRTTQTNEQGHYRLTLPESDVYQLRLTGDGLFESVQSFAHIEIADASRKLIVPPIELVARKAGRVELVFGGDVVVGRRYLRPQFGERPLIHPETRAADMAKLVAAMQPYFRSADFSAINLESILAESDPGAHAPKSVVFYTHPQILDTLKSLGVDYVSLGNNHTFDYLDSGLRTTFDALSGSGLGYSGAGFNETEALAPYRTRIKGHDYSMLGYVGWAGRVTPNQVAEADKGGAALGTEDNIRTSVSREAADNRVTIVQYHGNSEYSEAPGPLHEKRLRAAIDAGADLVVGHHPHVTHGLEVYKGKLIAWSLGNFLFDQFFIATHPAYVLKVWMDGEEFYRAEIIPIHVRDYRPMPAMADVRRHILQRVFTQSAKRGTNLIMSGGHGIITRDSGKATGKGYQAKLSCNPPEIIPLPFSLDPQKSAMTAKKDCAKPDDTIFGRDLLLRGDFESYGLQGVKERTWQARNGRFDLVRMPHNGRFAMNFRIDDSTKPAVFGLKTFARVLLQEDYSFAGWIKSEGRVKVSATVQYRPAGKNRYKALAEEPHLLLGSTVVHGGSWEAFRFDVQARKPKGKRALPMRVMLRFESLDGQKDVLLDDLVLIGWETPEQAAIISVPNRRTHVRGR